MGTGHQAKMITITNSIDKTSMASHAKKYHFYQKEMITQIPVLVANIWPLPKHLPWIMTCPKHVQKLLVVNQPGIILNLHKSRNLSLPIIIAHITLQCLVLPNLKRKQLNELKNRAVSSTQHARQSKRQFL